MGPTWGRQEPGGPQVCPMNFVIWAILRREKDAWTVCHSDFCLDIEILVNTTKAVDLFIVYT